MRLLSGILPRQVQCCAHEELHQIMYDIMAAAFLLPPALHLLRDFSTIFSTVDSRIFIHFVWSAKLPYLICHWMYAVAACLSLYLSFWLIENRKFEYRLSWIHLWVNGDNLEYICMLAETKMVLADPFVTGLYMNKVPSLLRKSSHLGLHFLGVIENSRYAIVLSVQKVSKWIFSQNLL